MKPEKPKGKKVAEFTSPTDLTELTGSKFPSHGSIEDLFVQWGKPDGALLPATVENVEATRGFFRNMDLLGKEVEERFSSKRIAATLKDLRLKTTNLLPLPSEESG